MNTEITGYLGDGFTGLEGHLDGLGLELGAGTDDAARACTHPLRLENMSEILGAPQCGINQLKQHRAMATRYDKLAVRYEATRPWPPPTNGSARHETRP